ncbi:hypothetical protein NQ317_004314 [Molorchus minor]|uniref:WD repeat-containing protein on Y chromosome n=1 Tax=Molorchus minor TaxID=1323400 RepID=A0ABQ9JZ44_9CUCU|nr:hypothetical protein NQ317_004314 [Molorchus minor]
MALTKSRRAREKDVPDQESVYKDPNMPLYKLLDETELTKLSKIFNRKHERRMDKEELRKVLYKVGYIEYDQDKFDDIFKKMNTSCNGYATWNEFISFLIIGFQLQEVSTEYKTLEDPIPLQPTMIRSHHRQPINRITFYPTVKPDRSTTWQSGSIMTCSNDGIINYWSLDMKLERTVQSTCPLLKVQPTWVTDMVVLPDVSIICTSSTERDLRFYDISARKFELRVMVTSLPFAVTTMNYTFSRRITDPSRLLLGDMAGNVKIISFTTEARGPFRGQPGIPLLSVRYESVVRNVIPNFKLLEIPRLHCDTVRQMAYYGTLRGAISCAECPKAVVISDVADGTTIYTYKIEMGAWSFALDEGARILATGGPDCLVRVWNPFVPRRPICTFYGHHTGIVQMVFQDNGKRLYSLSKDKCIKVWDIGLQAIVQSYIDWPYNLSEKGTLQALYNPLNRQWIIGSAMIAVLPLSPEQSPEHTDGDTHTAGISVVLYNRLFKVIITCGWDSYILVWNPFDGRRLIVIKNAHTVKIHGKVYPIEIICATFDPDYQRLLTSAHDGTLKIWNFNTGNCLRNMKIGPWLSITSLIWVKNRMMISGWNRTITEFADLRDIPQTGGSESKDWSRRHQEDISASVVRVPETVVTSSYAGELIFWSLETGQPYKQFDVSYPTERIKLQYQLTKTKEKTKDQIQREKRKSATLAAIKEKQKKPGLGVQKFRLQDGSSAKGLNLVVRDIYFSWMIPGPPTQLSKASSTKREKSVEQIVDQEYLHARRLGVFSMLFLKTRRNEPEIGTLLVGLGNGHIQVWNHHAAGGFITSFNAVYKFGDYVISMTTDINNEFLFTEEEPICMPEYRLRFPFMWGDRFVGRAARAVRGQAKPVLLSSIRGHLMPVSNLAYIDECEIILSASTDYSARMWTLGGRYLQTLGTFKPWKNIKPEGVIPKDFEFGIPPEIKRVASSTSLRVLSGGTLPKPLTEKQKQRRAQKESLSVDESKIYGMALTDPILGNHYRVAERTTKPRFIDLDTSFPYIPVYQHLITPQPVDIEKSNIIK